MLLFGFCLILLFDFVAWFCVCFTYCWLGFVFVCGFGLIWFLQFCLIWVSGLWLLDLLDFGISWFGGFWV